jgi:predicted acylesterase/phospholipase RssA
MVRSLFDLARTILAKTLEKHFQDPKDKVRVTQKLALCTYKDLELPARQRLDDALNILEKLETKDQETLGLMGSIHKKFWELDGQKLHLERSAAYYRRGYEQGPAGDNGYTGINAAYVLDLLASQEAEETRKAGVDSLTAGDQAMEATNIRKDLISKLPDLPKQLGKSGLETDYWFLVTAAEAFFGLEKYNEALEWLKKATVLPKVPPWAREATTRQLASLARLHAERVGRSDRFEETQGWKTLSEFLGKNEAGVRTAFAGKVGLALSGGGFRASLFHIGVLARLAELDMLRHVEVLSCVSGGSIIGAHYYLEVRKLLQEKTDGEIERGDYIAIIERIQNNFLAGVQTNIRTRVIASFPVNVRMIIFGDYSRTERVGELYEERIFKLVQDGEQDKPRYLNRLFVKPKNAPQEFTPKYDNYLRENKVPMLVLNATTLNTGHVWQFTASWMGEPPGEINAAIDTNERLRRMYYHEAPEGHRHIRLGRAVAASACVPGLFEPLTLTNLYPDRTVRLVDGGVHDNQGTASLLEENCTVQLVSDASGQMSSEANPSRGVLGVPLRTNSILMSRVREAQYCELEVRKNAGLLRGLMFIHLKKDLNVLPVDWIDCKDPTQPAKDANSQEVTSYGISKIIQASLAAIRTDLDSFSEVEAFALMTCGYRMTKCEFAASIRGFPIYPDSAYPWKFLVVEKLMNKKNGCNAQYRELELLLKIGANCAFKIWLLSRLLQVVAVVAGVSVFGSLVWWAVTHWNNPILRVGIIATPIFTGLAGLILGKTILQVVRYRETLERVFLGFVLALFGWFVAGVHLMFFDKWFLCRGRVAHLLKLK